MADTKYEHAGNADQLRDLQLDKNARCELCHYPQGYHIHNAGVISLQVVTLPSYRGEPERQGLMCSHCVQMCVEMDDTDYVTAVALIRPLPPETVPANQVLMAELVSQQPAEIERTQVIDDTGTENV
jgi:hypothetical protein